MNIYSYIDDYGIYTFDERKFTEVDAVIFSFLSYANFEHIFDEKDEVTIKEAGRMHLGFNSSKSSDIIAVKEANKILRYMKDANRYKNCILSKYKYIGNEDVQFGVISIEYQKNKVYISYEGTNELFSGWKENLLLSYKFPTETHILGIKYLEDNYSKGRKRIILGGHSKGGNIALVAGMYVSSRIKNKIERIYGVDSPGLLEEEFRSKKYEEIENKYIHILPEFSIVGILLNSSNDLVVASKNKTVLAHSIAYWLIDGNEFKRKELNPLSQKLREEINNWSITHSEEEKKSIIENLETILKKANVASIVEIKKEKKNIFNILYESKDLNNDTKKAIFDFIEMFIKCFSEVKKEEAKEFINHYRNLLTKRQKE